MSNDDYGNIDYGDLPEQDDFFEVTYKEKEAETSSDEDDDGRIGSASEEGDDEDDYDDDDGTSLNNDDIFGGSKKSKGKKNPKGKTLSTTGKPRKSKKEMEDERERLAMDFLRQQNAPSVAFPNLAPVNNTFQPSSFQQPPAFQQSSFQQPPAFQPYNNNSFSTPSFHQQPFVPPPQPLITPVFTSSNSRKISIWLAPFQNFKVNETLDLLPPNPKIIWGMGLQASAAKVVTNSQSTQQSYQISDQQQMNQNVKQSVSPDKKRVPTTAQKNKITAFIRDKLNNVTRMTVTEIKLMADKIYNRIYKDQSYSANENQQIDKYRQLFNLN